MQGQRVVFGAQVGVIYDIESGQDTPFGMKDNVNVFDLWPPKITTRGLGRQG